MVDLSPVTPCVAMTVGARLSLRPVRLHLAVEGGELFEEARQVDDDAVADEALRGAV